MIRHTGYIPPKVTNNMVHARPRRFFKREGQHRSNVINKRKQVKELFDEEIEYA